MAFTRSTTGCLACKIKHKKCDETKPYCVRCQKAAHKCPGYTYIRDPTNPYAKVRTVSVPRVRGSQFRATAYQETPLANTEEVDLQLQIPLPLDWDLVTETSDNIPSAFAIGTFSEDNMSNSSLSSSINFTAPHGLAVNTPDLGPVLPPPSTISARPMTSGQASLLAALFSLAQPTDIEPSSWPIQPTTATISDPSAPSGSNWSPSDTERQGDGTMYESDDPGDVVSVISHQPALDKTAESNALPFVLQSYASWVHRMAFEPIKAMVIARDFVFSQFEGGGQSRWILSLLANIGSRIGRVGFAEESQSSMLVGLQTAVRWQLGAAKSHRRPDRAELVKVLDSVVETILMYFCVGPMSEIMTLRQEAAPIFQRLYSDLPHVSVDLSSLLYHPLSSLRHYAHIDIIFSTVIDMPTLFQYEVAFSGNRYSDPSQSIAAIQSDQVLEWVHGIPFQLVLVFAKLKLLRHDGFAPNAEMVASLEREIRDLQPCDSSLSRTFLVIMRSVVQECWKQSALIYLYMAVCGDPCDTPRVQTSLKQYMKLLRAVKPGRTPDEFLIVPLYLVSPAAQRNRDREVIRQRFLGAHAYGGLYHANNSFMCVIEDYWAQADAEGRPIVWSDIAVSRGRLLGV